MAATAKVIGELNRQVESLEGEITASFDEEPDSKVVHTRQDRGRFSEPGSVGFGDAPEANGIPTPSLAKNYADTSPITRDSGIKRFALARYASDTLISDASFQWAFANLNKSPGARTLCDRHRTAGDSHYQAVRKVANRFVGILHEFLESHTPYDERMAGPAITQRVA